jgi:arginase family enzyme
MELLRALWANTAVEVVSMDVVELRPLAGDPLSEFTAAKIIQKCLSYGFHSRRGGVTGQGGRR